MQITEFIKDFVENHTIEKVTDINDGTIVAPLSDETYLVNHGDVTN